MNKILNVLKKYDYFVQESGLKTGGMAWILASVVFSFIVFFVSFFISAFIFRTPTTDTNFLKLPIILFLVILDITLGLPFILTSRKIENIEANFPDALKQMADTLKSGGTYESAIREIATTSSYGYLSKEMELILRNLEEGQNFENALKRFSEKTDSLLIKRTITIIIQSVQAGAGLSDVLDNVANDMLEMYRIKKDRKTKTLMQSLFIFAAAAVIAPGIFGMISEIIGFLISNSANSGIIAKPEIIADAIASKNFITLLIEIYMFLEILASSAMLALMREGKASKSIIYLPVLLFVGFGIYYVSGILIRTLLPV